MEVVSQTSETYIKQFRMTLSKVLQWVHNRPIQRWSRSEALQQCGWMDIEMVSMERTLMSARTVLLTKQSQNLYDQLVENRKLKTWTLSELTQKMKRSWRVRSCRMLQLLGPSFLRRSEKPEVTKRKFRNLEENVKQKIIKIFNGEHCEYETNTIWV